MKKRDKMFSNEMMEELIHGLTNIFTDDILMIILYGSVVRKEETSESDIDVAIVIKKQMNLEVRKQFTLWSADLDLKFDRVFTIIDIEKDMLDKWGNTLPFYKNIKEEGVILWKVA